MHLSGDCMFETCPRCENFCLWGDFCCYKKLTFNSWSVLNQGRMLGWFGFSRAFAVVELGRDSGWETAPTPPWALHERRPDVLLWAQPFPPLLALTHVPFRLAFCPPACDVIISFL